MLSSFCSWMENTLEYIHNVLIDDYFFIFFNQVVSKKY